MGPTASVWKLRKKRRAQLHHVRIDKVIWSAPARHAAAITAARGKTEPPPRTSVHCASSWTHIYILDIAGKHHLSGMSANFVRDRSLREPEIQSPPSAFPPPSAGPPTSKRRAPALAAPSTTLVAPTSLAP